ncbi:MULTISPECIES: Sec-independent protein translocase subunit TatA [Actinomadura]|uniref:Sec-independent protein translocase protein TatA n=1 Tax=Actinomadura litoris TaxID=2678616 RepID=A0A7K1KZP1_9ACTN|nr:MULTISPECIES: Sec-independent protein translocase subunit TatA [Actinomadura]MBT2211845.1 Sec-independent protein translocase subunit TatA [Actinomadura sp. NEAU-AAG7]MUN37662.1 twin-arginine translocase TatA/TatE family subunit [Actinomadura litoris]
MGNIGTPELLIVLLVVVLIFGSAKLPQLARSLGKSARILKAETKGLRDDDEPDTAAKSDAAQAKAGGAQSNAARDRAAQLREEAARLEREAAAQEAPRQQGALSSGEPIQGVPVSDYGNRKTS